jgi:hypothetical protein
MENKYKILFKYASRSRTQKFFVGLDNILTNLSDLNNFCILVSLDIDDYSMNNKETINRLLEYVNKYPEKIIIKFGRSKNKIDAINRDVNEIKEKFNFDILVNFSDDMEFTQHSFDEIIRNKFYQFYPDTDGNIYFNDGFVGDKFSTMSIIGRKYYDNFNYIYHPSYYSLWCDNEYTEVARRNQKILYFHENIYKHNHPANIGGFIDEQLKKTESFELTDRNNYQERLNNNFPIYNINQKNFKYGISLLICTLSERKNFLDRLLLVLNKSISNSSSSENIEILIDDRDSKTSIGEKRNSLLNLAKKEFVAFIDDDDLVSEDYVDILLNAIQDYPDCVSLNGIITTDGTDEHKFIHSIKYNEYSENKDLKEYYRPPNHLNCIKSTIAKQVSFTDKSYGEDTDWALELCNRKLIKSESTINQFIYLYQYVKNK